jgi:catechol 2,3-dioxygenase-like lactoylglutathione lyase family enzyme
MKNHSRITGTRYVLAVRDLDISGAFYVDKLGFKTIWKGDGWHFLRRDQCVMMLGECRDERSAFEMGNHSYFAYLEVQHIDDFYREYLDNQVEILAPVSDKPWGQREFAIRTIDGHRITFGEVIKP